MITAAQTPSAMIYVGKGKWAIVDEVHYTLASSINWHLDQNGYAVHDDRQRIPGGKGKKSGGKTLLHRLVMNAPKGMSVDHINHNVLDNRRSVNLRICTHRENMKNMIRVNGPPKTSIYKGVCRHSRHPTKWYAQITVDFKKIYIGLYLSETEAALAYNEAAKKHHGEFANLNKVDA